MSDDNEITENAQSDHHDPPDQPDTSASTIFAEMMRQQAERRQPPPLQSHVPSVLDQVSASDHFHSPSSPETTIPAFESSEEMNLSSIAADVPDELPPETEVQERREQALQEQRIRRIQRRKERRRQRTVGMFGGFFRTVLVILLSAGLVSTIFTWFTDPQFFNINVAAGLQVADATRQVTVQPTALTTPNWLRRIGIVSGHRGPNNDPGAVCPDGLTETAINFEIAQYIVRNLRGLGYSVDLLDEFDPRLESYQAAALVSIHANTCQDFGERVSGYLVAKAAARPEGGPDTQLAECISLYYGQATQLERRFTLTTDMTDYHTFREIHALTPSAIVELGFMLADRALLTEQQDLLANSITEGILCFLQAEPNATPLPIFVTPTATVPSPGG